MKDEIKKELIDSLKQINEVMNRVVSTKNRIREALEYLGVNKEEYEHLL